MATNQIQQENMDSQDLDEMETLSLCDLPLNNQPSSWDDYYSSTQEQSSSFEHDFFEFFSRDFNTSSICSNPKDHVMFCGKLITYKQAEEAPIKERDSLTNKSKPKETERTSSLATKPEKGFHQEGKRLLVEHKRGRPDASLLASPMKSRWYLFVFGVGRFPKEMKLSDIKTRQSKMMQARASPPNNNTSETTKSRSVRSRSKSVWSMLNVFGCRNQQANLVVKASFGCLPIL